MVVQCVRHKMSHIEVMTMKKIAKVLSLLLLFVLVGCSASKISEESNAKLQAVNYLKLSKRKREEVYFKFRKSKSAYNYAVNMTITNKSDKDVRFYLGKFIILNADDPDLEISSSSNKAVVVEPNSRVTVHHLFEHISQVIFNGPSGYYYLNSNHLLANLK